MHRIYSIIKIAIILYLLVAAGIYLLQRRFIYFSPKNEKRYGTLEKKIEIKNKGVALRGWIVNEGKNNAILYYGGNSERIENNIPDFKGHLSNYTVYLINYRGYGESEGSPSEDKLCNDAVYIYDQIKCRHNTVSLLGRSIGSGVAMYVASRRDIDKLVLITPFDSLANVAQNLFWMYPMSILIKDKYQSHRLAGKISSKILVIIAEKDEVIPKRRSIALIRKLNPKNLTVRTIKGAGHNSISIYPEFWSYLKSFLNR